MMDIFRKFRLQAALRQRATAYILHAIGEIVLIIAGILLALNINNWNEKKRLAREENDLLKNLESEIMVNIGSLGEIRYNNSEVYKSVLLLKNLIGKKHDELRKHNIDSLLYVSIMMYDFQPNQFIMTQLKSTDKLKIIQSQKLKMLLYDWEKAMNAKNEAFQMWNTYFMNSLIPFLDEHASIRNMDMYGDFEWAQTMTPLEDNTLNMFQMLQFDNKLDNHMWCLHSFSSSIDNLISIAEEISEEIRKFSDDVG